MPRKSLISKKHISWGTVIAGLILGAASYHVVLIVGGWALVDTQELEQQRAELQSLQDENRQLSDQLFSPREIPGISTIDLVRPYDEEADATAVIREARTKAREAGKILMVTFGANWCQDCRTLYVRLDSDEVADYVGDRFDFVNVNVGKFNRNVELAEQLGVNLDRGIPVAIFFDPQGGVIGATNNGELEPARLYTSKQILKFVRDVAERSRILAPDAVR